MRRSCELALLVCAGCTADDFVDLSGVYRVDGNVVSMPCGTSPQPVSQPWPFLQFVESPDFTGYVLERCSDMAATNCSGDRFLDAFPTPSESGWFGEITGTVGSSPCMLVYTAQSATLDGTHLVVAIEAHREDAPASACTVAEAQLRSTLMPCVELERIDATKL